METFLLLILVILAAIIAIHTRQIARTLRLLEPFPERTFLDTLANKPLPERTTIDQIILILGEIHGQLEVIEGTLKKSEKLS